MKPERPKRPAASVHRRLRLKLEALVAAPGTPDEGLAAQKKLKRLLDRYEFLAVDAEGIFAGKFEQSTTAYPVADIADLTLASHIKWAIEESTPIRCAWHGTVLLAEATPRTTEKLKKIAQNLEAGMTELWLKFSSFPSVNSCDRSLFLRGLYDGCLNQIKPQGEPLPARTVPTKATRRVKRAAVAFAAGLGLHPYSVAVQLGRQLRFETPLVEISQQLETMKPKEICT